ncbi:MAG: hypothetical protein RL219_1811 [Actinomycetota bacterium]
MTARWEAPSPGHWVRDASWFGRRLPAVCCEIETLAVPRATEMAASALGLGIRRVDIAAVNTVLYTRVVPLQQSSTRALGHVQRLATRVSVDGRRRERAAAEVSAHTAAARSAVHHRLVALCDTWSIAGPLDPDAGPAVAGCASSSDTQLTELCRRLFDRAVGATAANVIWSVYAAVDTSAPVVPFDARAHEQLRRALDELGGRLVARGSAHEAQHVFGLARREIKATILAGKGPGADALAARAGVFAEANRAAAPAFLGFDGHGIRTAGMPPSMAAITSQWLRTVDSEGIAGARAGAFAW